MDNTTVPADVASVFDACDDDTRNGVLGLRELILRTAAETEGVGSITETLKWGEPAYLTTVDRFEGLFGDTLTYDGSRALLFNAGDDVPEAELRACIEMALTYHLGG